MIEAFLVQVLFILACATISSAVFYLLSKPRAFKLTKKTGAFLYVPKQLTTQDAKALLRKA